MISPIAFQSALHATRELADSARPDAPVVDDDAPRQHIRTPRRWTAARLRSFARGTYHLANRVDPVGLPR